MKRIIIVLLIINIIPIISYSMEKERNVTTVHRHVLKVILKRRGGCLKRTSTPFKIPYNGLPEQPWTLARVRLVQIPVMCTLWKLIVSSF